MQKFFKCRIQNAELKTNFSFWLIILFQELFYSLENNTDCSSYFDSISSIFRLRSSLVRSIVRSLVKARIICMFTWIALLLFRTLESIATPCSVNAIGGYLSPILSPLLEVTNCDLQ